MKNKILALLGGAFLLTACETGSGDGQQDVTLSAAPGTAADFKATIRDRVFFDFNQTNISADAKKVLEAQAGWFKTFSATQATIAGNCDARGTREFNLALGERRAAAAKAELVKLGVSADRLKTVSYGKDRLQVPGDTPTAHAQNRNATTSIN
jgi:peptidoglycan-associated lipoprotein